MWRQRLCQRMGHDLTPRQRKLSPISLRHGSTSRADAPEPSAEHCRLHLLPGRTPEWQNTRSATSKTIALSLDLSWHCASLISKWPFGTPTTVQPNHQDANRVVLTAVELESAEAQAHTTSSAEATGVNTRWQVAGHHDAATWECRTCFRIVSAAIQSESAVHTLHWTELLRVKPVIWATGVHVGLPGSITQLFSA